MLGVLANQPVAMAGANNRYGYGYGSRAGYGAYAEAAEQREQGALPEGSEEGLPAGLEQPALPEKGRRGRAKQTKKRRLATLRAGSQKLLHWLYEKE